MAILECPVCNQQKLIPALLSSVRGHKQDGEKLKSGQVAIQEVGERSKEFYNKKTKLKGKLKLLLFLIMVIMIPLLVLLLTEYIFKKRKENESLDYFCALFVLGLES